MVLIAIRLCKQTPFCHNLSRIQTSGNDCIAQAGHTRIVGIDPCDGLDGLGLGPALDLNYLCHDLNQGSVSYVICKSWSAL